jgi:hypothetical protein
VNDLTTEKQKPHPHDPDVERILHGMSAMRHERDSLLLDKANLQASLSSADAKIDHLQGQLARALAQRDHFMVKNVELATNFSILIDTVDKIKRAFTSVTQVATGNDDGAKAIAQQFAPGPRT